MPGPRADTPLTRELDRRGIRYGWMAERLGVKPWTFSRIEAGVQLPHPGWYERAAEVLGVSVDSITPRVEVAA